ncbi:MAG: hypothetical protein ACOY58_02145, partial [Candidatus Micrarchaeota archaeon]
MELNKRKAELEFQKTVMKSDLDKDIARIASSAAELSDKAKASGVEIVLPGQRRLDELAKALDDFSPEEMREGLKVRDGMAFQTLKDRGMIVKRNFENRFEIAKLAILTARMGADERKALSEILASGALASPLDITTLTESDRKRLARIMRRCGIECVAGGKGLEPALGKDSEKESRLHISNRPVWVGQLSKPKLEANLKTMESLNARIQLKNAERQLRAFTEQEETDFAELQKQYLDLLKEQDELLKDYNEEENLSV